MKDEDQNVGEDEEKFSFVDFFQSTPQVDKLLVSAILSTVWFEPDYRSNLLYVWPQFDLYTKATTRE